MPISLIDKIKPKNNGSFAIVDAVDVEMPDGTRLSTWKGGESGITLNTGEIAMPASADWRAVASGDVVAADNSTTNRVYVAVAYGSDVAAYSYDGIHWTETKMPVSAKWNDVTFGNGMFVAVAGATTIPIAYSSDGINWELTSKLDTTDLKCVAFGNGVFVALGLGDECLYSTNGINWMTATTPCNVWRLVIYGMGKFIAIATGTNAAYSTNGIDWTYFALPDSYSWEDIAVSDEMFVLTGVALASPFYSFDGISWHRSDYAINSTEMHSLSSLIYANGHFFGIKEGYRSVAYDAEYDDDGVFPDGVSWGAHDNVLPDANWNLIYHDGDKFIVIGDSTALAYSEDGVTWIDKVEASLTQDGENVTDVVRSLMPYPIVNASETDILMVDETYYSLDPDTYYVFGEVDSLPIYCAEPNDGRLHEFVFEFTPAEGFAGITFGSTEPKWANDLQFTPGKLCQVSIMRGIGVMVSA